MVRDWNKSLEKAFVVFQVLLFPFKCPNIDINWICLFCISTSYWDILPKFCDWAYLISNIFTFASENRWPAINAKQNWTTPLNKWIGTIWWNQTFQNPIGVNHLSRFSAWRSGKFAKPLKKQTPCMFSGTIFPFVEWVNNFFVIEH